MKLSERKRKILGYVIDDYITTAQPVSSKSITEKYMKDISSATVRSELAGLEELGYLNQLHTSSGRVPSIEAYKLYVSELMDRGNLTGEEIVAIKEAFKDRANNLESVVQNTVKVVSELTDYTSVAVTSYRDDEKILKIDIFKFKPTQALLLIVTESMLIRDKFIDIPEKISDSELDDAKEIISKMLVGKSLKDIAGIEEEIAGEFEAYREIFERVISAIEEYMEKDRVKVKIAGEGKILNHSEYNNDGEKVKNFLSVVTSKDKLYDLLSKDDDSIEINIKIGGEEEKDLPEDCSLVTATYSAGGVKLGTYGVIGPLRMDYQKVVSVLEGVGNILEEILNNKK